VQSGWTDLDLAALELLPGESFAVEDLLTGARFNWLDRRNFVMLTPGEHPAHVMRILRQL